MNIASEERRTVRSVADLQSAARHHDADRYSFLAAKLEEAGRKNAAAMARRWAIEHRRVAAMLMNPGSE
jgi:hypothetical protein